jgi:hypothetical protein
MTIACGVDNMSFDEMSIDNLKKTLELRINPSLLLKRFFDTIKTVSQLTIMNIKRCFNKPDLIA